MHQKMSTETNSLDIRPLKPIVSNGRILPHIKLILNRCVCVFLTGHGSFKSRLRRMKCTECDHCLFCGSRENSHRVLIECDRYESLRLDHNLTKEQLKLNA